VIEVNDKVIRKMISIILLIVMIAIFSLNSPLFFSANNFATILREASYVGIIACGMTFVIITGGIDISVGSIMALCAMVCSNMLRFTQISLVIVILAVLLLGIGLGLLNGILVTKLRIPDFIVTLATMNIYRGITKVINATDVDSLKNSMIQNQTFKLLGGRIGLLYLVVIIFIIMLLGSHYILNNTKIGLYMYAIGSNTQAAKLTGISFENVKIFAFTYTGFASGVAGVMIAARMMTATTEIGVGMEFSVISAIVIGGCSLQGGRGDMAGTMIGVLLMSVINSGIVQIGISTYYQPIIKGIIIIIAVLFDIGYVQYVDKKTKTKVKIEIGKV